MLASKTALAIRYDALGEDINTEMGVENRAKLEMRVRNLEEGKVCSFTDRSILSKKCFIEKTLVHQL